MYISTVSTAQPKNYYDQTALLKAFEELYNFVASENGDPAINLDMTIATLEYGTAHTHEILLKDSGIPSEIIKKVSGVFTNCETFEDLQLTLRDQARQIKSLVHPVELIILQRYL